MGGEIRQNKKTFLLLHALEVATPDQRAKLNSLLASNGPDKVPQIMDIFKACNVDAWSIELKEKYLQMALANLEDIAVTSTRKTALLSLANYLMQREK